MTADVKLSWPMTMPAARYDGAAGYCLLHQHGRTSSSISLLCHFLAICRCSFFCCGWLSIFKTPCIAQPCVMLMA